MLKAFPKRSSEGPGASHPQWTFDVIRGFHFRRNLCRPWGCQQGFSLGSKWWMGSCCFHVFCCLKHILRQSDSSRITLCSSRIMEKNKMKKEPVSVPCQTWKHLSKRAASTVLRAKHQVPAGWVGGECLKDAAARHQEAAVLLQYCSWCFVSSRLRLRARRKLVTHHQWDPQKTKGKVPLTCFSSRFLLVSRYLDKMLGNFRGMGRHSCKMFLFSYFSSLSQSHLRLCRTCTAIRGIPGNMFSYCCVVKMHPAGQ